MADAPRFRYSGFMNGNRRRVILYGNTLILQGVWASLAKCPTLDVVVLDQPSQSSPEELAACCPAAVIFDLSVIQPELLLGLFQQPALLLVGMNAETHQALVWSGRKVAALDAAGLVQVLVETGNVPVTTI
jgi:hypothetical protein